MNIFQLAPTGEQGGSQGPEWLATFLRDPPLLLIIVLVLLGGLSIMLVGHVYINKGAPFVLQWEVVTNVAIVQAMALSAQLTSEYLEISYVADLGIAIFAGMTVLIVGRFGSVRWANEHGVVAGWAILGALWFYQAVELGQRFDGRIAIFYGLLGMLAALGAFYALKAGEEPFREVTNSNMREVR